MASDIFPLLIFLLIPAFQELSASKPLKILFGIAVIFSMTVQAAGSFLVFPAFTYADNQWNWSHSQLLNVAHQPYLMPPRFWPNAPGFATVDRMLSLWRGAPGTLLDYSQKIEAPGCPTNVKPGEKFNIQVLCRNTGGQTWLDLDNSVGAFYISLSLSWLDSTGAVVEKSSVLIPSALDAGQSVPLAAPLQAPRTKGLYSLALSMAVNGDSFQNHGNPALILPVEVGAANEMASIDVGSPEGRPYLLSGFSGDEKAPQLNFAWSVGRESTVSLKVDRDGPGRLVINGFCLPPLKSVDVTVLVNDQEAGLLQVGPQLANYSLVLNKPLRVGDNKLTFRYNKTGIPAQLQPGSGDQRDLSICWDTIRLEAGP